jgi:hypothetical protein
MASEALLSSRSAKGGQLVVYLGMGRACTLEFASLRAALLEAGMWWCSDAAPRRESPRLAACPRNS